MSPFRYTFSLPTHSLLAESISISDVQNMCLVFIYLYLIISEIIQVIKYLLLLYKRRECVIKVHLRNRKRMGKI